MEQPEQLGDSVARKGELFAQAADEDWIVVLSHEKDHPIGRLVRDRDRFRYESEWRRMPWPRCCTKSPSEASSSS